MKALQKKNLPKSTNPPMILLSDIREILYSPQVESLCMDSEEDRNKLFQLLVEKV